MIGFFFGINYGYSQLSSKICKVSCSNNNAVEEI